jgi:hypothetical protein
MTESSSRLKPLKGEASRIFKLCLEKDTNTALQGLALLRRRQALQGGRVRA